MEDMIKAMEVRGLEVWIDDQGYTRRTIMEIVVSGEALVSLDGQASMKLEMGIFDINEEITIRLPEGYEEFETESEPIATSSPTSVYDELLALIPDTPDTRSLVFLNDYVLLRKALNVALPGPEANQEEVKDHFMSLAIMINEIGVPTWGEAPFISGYTQYALRTSGMGEYLAFDQRNVHQSAVAGVPPGKLGVMLGNFDPAATDAALEHCAASVPECEPPLRESHDGIAFYSWGGDLEADFTRILGPPALDNFGRGGRIAVQESHVFYTMETPGMEGLIEASLGQRRSLLDVENFSLLANAMSQLGAYASLLSDQTLSVEDGIAAMLGDVGTEEARERIRAQLSATPGLRPYLAFATGGGVDQEGPYMALALVHPNAETAVENVTLLRRRVNESSSFMTRQPWAEMIDHVEVRAEGRVLLGKFRGRIARSWIAVVFNRDSLLFHEGGARTSRPEAAQAQVPTAAATAAPATEQPVAQPQVVTVQAAVEPEPVATAAPAVAVSTPRSEKVQDSGQAVHRAEGQAIIYSVYPPDSGDHWGRWAQCGIYGEEVNDEYIVHNLEHGQVVISYKLPDPQDVDRLLRNL